MISYNGHMLSCYAGQPTAVHHRLDDDKGLIRDSRYEYDGAGRLSKTTAKISSMLRLVNR